jgi:hypothetical protein
MTIVDPAQGGASPLVARVKAILFSPSSEWDHIDTEPATIKGLYTGYVCILAGVATLASLIGRVVFGFGGFGFVYRPPILQAVVGAVFSYVMTLVGVFVVALVIEALAPTFGGEKNRIQALKVAAYSGTAGWVASIVTIFPPLSILVLLGALYGVYLLYLGLPKLMKSPADKAVGYTAAVVVTAFVVSLVVAGIMMVVGGGAMGVGRMAQLDGGHVSGAVRLPGGGSLSYDGDAPQGSFKAVEALAEQYRAGKAGGPLAVDAVLAVPPDQVVALMPASLPGGLDRGVLTTGSRKLGGVSTSNVKAVYAKGDSRVTLTVTDMAAAGALASLGGALNISADKQTATGYQKIGKVDGRITTEAFDNSTRSGKYAVMVADRFLVEAQGANVDIDQLKAAADSVGFDRLEGLAKSG